MNPYEPSQIADLQTDTAAELITGSPWPVWREIFAAWERRRLIYNAVLIVVVLAGFAIFGLGHSVGATILECLFAGFAANCCFFAGPLLESYVTWLQQRRVSWGRMLFFVGLGFSVLLTLFILAVRHYAILYGV